MSTIRIFLSKGNGCCPFRILEYKPLEGRAWHEAWHVVEANRFSQTHEQITVKGKGNFVPILKISSTLICPNSKCSRKTVEGRCQN